MVSLILSVSYLKMKTVSEIKRYEELDALRGIAALIVVLFHITLDKKEAQFGFKLGTTGVDLFFIISGFVILMSITKVKTSADFVINRVSRLYPTYWACVTFTFILICAVSLYEHNKIPFLQYVGNLTMFQFYLRINDLDGPYWTMIVEMLFYIGVLFLFHYKLLKNLNVFGISFILSLIIFVTFFNTISINRVLGIIPLLQFIPLFFAGTVFYRMYIEGNNLKNYGILTLCLIVQIYIFDYSGRSHMYISHFEYAMMMIIYFSLFVLFINGKLRFIVSKLTLFLGKISFALYLIHQYISVNLIIPIAVNHFGINFWIASFCISLPVVIMLATLITYYIEIPFSKKMKEKLKTKFCTKLKPSHQLT